MAEGPAGSGSAEVSSRVPNARTWSKTVPAAFLDLRDLDVHVLKQHPEALAAMGRSPSRSPADRLVVTIVLLVCLCGILAPLAALVAPVGGPLPRGGRTEGLNDSDARVFLAVCSALAVVAVLLVAWSWWRSGRWWSGVEVAALAVTAVAGAIAVLRDLDDLPLVTLGSVVLAVGTGLAVGLASRGPRGHFGRWWQVVGTPDTDRVRRVVADLEPRRQEKLLEERRRAVARLRERGLVDDLRAAEVLALPLGCR